MRTVQETFNAVIDAGLYGDGNPWMCHALDDALAAKIISEDDWREALAEIKSYLEPSRSLSLNGHLALMHRSVYYAKEHTNLNIYRDWANRPVNPE